MPNASLSASIFINAKSDFAFDYVSDLSKHGEWSANPLQVEAINAAPVGLGKQYRSNATVKGLAFTAELIVTEYQRPTLFAFEGHDSTGKFLHKFTFISKDNGTYLTRYISFTLTLR